jgi:acyl-CoA oxidase
MNPLLELVLLSNYPTEVTSVFSGARERWQSLIKGTPLAPSWSASSFSSAESLRRVSERYCKACELIRGEAGLHPLRRYLFLLIDVGPFYLNWDAFLPTIEMLGSDEQVGHYRALIEGFQIIGAYGQTEIGHGSDVKHLRLRAEFDAGQDCFVLESGGPEGVKFWAGNMGLFSTHVVVQAQTFVKGKSLGLQTFVVQIRDKAMQPLKGVEVGDIGKKLGFKRVDNGFLRLTQFRTPRQTMLSRFVQVSREGDVAGL